MSFSPPQWPEHSFTCAKRLLLVALVVGASVWASPALQAQQPAAPKRTAAKGPKQQMTLRNITRDTVTIELRVGDAADCANNPPAAKQQLAPGHEWLIASHRAICWRRSDAKAPPGSSSWHRHLLKAGDQLKLTI